MAQQGDSPPELSRPIAVRWQATQSQQDLVAALTTELEAERARSLQLLQSLAQERKRVYDLETYLLEASRAKQGGLPLVSSVTSMASTEDGLRSWAPRNFSTESLDSNFLDEDQRRDRSRSPIRSRKNPDKE